jgi:hypothetical protein
MDAIGAAAQINVVACAGQDLFYDLLGVRCEQYTRFHRFFLHSRPYALLVEPDDSRVDIRDSMCATDMDLSRKKSLITETVPDDLAISRTTAAKPAVMVASHVNSGGSPLLTIPIS